MLIMNIKMAINSLRGSKLRTLLTVLGIVVGVVSVVTFISFGEGLKKQVTDEVRGYGNDVLQVNPGKAFERDEEGNITSFDFLASLTSPPLGESDLNAIKLLDNIKIATGFMLVGNQVDSGDNQQRNVMVAATDSGMIEILNQKVADGNFLSDDVSSEYVTVLGSGLKRDLFGEGSAIGRKVVIKSKEFIVIGVLEEYKSLFSGGGFGADLNRAAYIPIKAGKTFTQNVAQFMEFDIKVNDVQKIDETISDISESLNKTRGSDDFSISRPEEFLDMINSVLNMLTTAVVAIAALSILVGGIGITNIMFVTVSERTREIGIRKAIGATNRQIMLQFLIEAIIITLIGALIGIGISAIISYGVSIFTEFKPTVTLTSVVLALIASSIFGILFGLVPAVKAARKDPIESLRHD